ncbi:NADP-dependent oxidoreductase [Actinomyces radicidentis]|uniref:NADP-dependent oxidoreductase n=1 Tax=Actinomyces radicidentis TaxID=111015 RepID=UPI0026DEEF77|nr:NADP-dependent oxidoreductase [Actinomyces radicidentis]
MKAYILNEYGTDPVLTDVPEPHAGPGEVVIDVAAVSVNPVDALLAKGTVRLVVPLDLPTRLGFDAAGTVVEVGDGVTGLAVGDRVVTRADQAHMGTFAERVAVDASVVAPAPSGTSLAEAASLPLAALTAWQALVDRGHLAAGQKVIVHAGAGGVGSLAIQIAKHLGAEVATTVSPRNAELVRSLGADHVIDYHSQDFTEVLSGYDLVLDGVGEKNVLRSLTVLKPDGLVVGLNTPPDAALARTLGATGFKGLLVRAMGARVQRRAKRLGVRYEYHLMHPDVAELREIIDLVDSGELRPVVGRELPFSEVPAALASAHNGGGHGKTVLVR